MVVAADTIGWSAIVVYSGSPEKRRVRLRAPLAMSQKGSLVRES